jgi:hypothetical protein
MRFAWLFIIFTLFASLFLSGCYGLEGNIQEEIEREMMSDIPIIGWFWRIDDSKDSVVEDNLKQNRISSGDGDDLKSDQLPLVKSPDCPEHQYWNYNYNSCMCESDYYMDGGRCISKASRQCSVDRDCSPDGRLSVCSGQYAKRVYYCDLNSYRCVGGKGVGTVVDCRTEYGSDYSCVNGNCVV